MVSVQISINSETVRIFARIAIVLVPNALDQKRVNAESAVMIRWSRFHPRMNCLDTAHSRAPLREDTERLMELALPAMNLAWCALDPMLTNARFALTQHWWNRLSWLGILENAWLLVQTQNNTTIQRWNALIAQTYVQHAREVKMMNAYPAWMGTISCQREKLQELAMRNAQPKNIEILMIIHAWVVIPLALNALGRMIAIVLNAVLDSIRNPRRLLMLVNASKSVQQRNLGAMMDNVMLASKIALLALIRQKMCAWLARLGFSWTRPEPWLEDAKRRPSATLSTNTETQPIIYARIAAIPAWLALQMEMINARAVQPAKWRFLWVPMFLGLVWMNVQRDSITLEVHVPIVLPNARHALAEVRVIAWSVLIIILLSSHQLFKCRDSVRSPVLMGSIFPV